MCPYHYYIGWDENLHFNMVMEEEEEGGSVVG